MLTFAYATLLCHLSISNRVANRWYRRYVYNHIIAVFIINHFAEFYVFIDGRALTIIKLLLRFNAF